MSPTICHCASASKCGANSCVDKTSLKFSCSHKTGGQSLDDEEVSCRRKSMRISRQFERDEMCYRNDLEVIPFSTDATIEEDFLFKYQLPGFA